MHKVVGVKFNNGNRIYYFDPNGKKIEKEDFLIVETEKGMQMGVAKTEIVEMDKKKLFLPLKKVIRLASKEDIKQGEENNMDSLKALNRAKKIATDLKLNMNFNEAYYTFERTQLILTFVADERVDFRELAKRLASTYKTRIELRQIGVRDKAKEIGGLGPCGRRLCCNAFLNDFESVSINMAKNQELALNPTKINGVCGRLLCCLNYEDDLYTELKKNLPRIGINVNNKNAKGKVINTDILKQTYTVEREDKTIVVVDVNESNKWSFGIW